MMIARKDALFGTGLRRTVLGCSFLLFAAAFLMFNAKSAQAVCGSCLCEQWDTLVTRGLILAHHVETREFINEEFTKNQNWILEDFYKDFVDPALKMMDEQLVVNGMNQMMALGALFDAQSQIRAEQLFQQHVAEAHNDYRPGTDMCVWGTAAMHINGASSRARLTAHVLTKRSIDRQLGTKTSAAQVDEGDSASRIEQVRILYCNPNDNMGQMLYMCGNGGPANRRNRDVDYGRVMSALTLDANFSDAALGPGDEQDLFALSNYLYVNHPFTRIVKDYMETVGGREAWMEMRAVTAKHLVAENSFNNIVAMKSSSPDASGPTAAYLANVFARMGIAPDDAATLVGAHPSYYAMLQVLGQSIYQTPSFYTSLYDTPANVKRKTVAMQAIGLMVGRDTYLSELREEAVLSQLLEMEVVKAEESLSNIAGKLKRNEKNSP